MKRRSFLTGLATLVSWLTMRPKVHADAVNGSRNSPDRRQTITRHLWDGEHRIEQSTPPYAFDGGSALAEPRAPRLSDFGEVYTRRYAHLTGETRFRRVVVVIDQTNPDPTTIDVHYEYVSGPKWWADPRRVVFHARLDDGQLWPFRYDDVVRDRILSYQFREVVFEPRHGLTADERRRVLTRVRFDGFAAEMPDFK